MHDRLRLKSAASVQGVLPDHSANNRQKGIIVPAKLYFDQAKREITTRYDFRGSTAVIDLDKEEPSLQLTAEDEYKLQAVIDILLTKMLKRNVPVKSLVYGKTEPTGKVLKKKISIQQGLSKDQCKSINQQIKNLKVKVQPQVNGDLVRVTGKSKDDLQVVIQGLKDADFDFDMQFINYR